MEESQSQLSSAPSGSSSRSAGIPIPDHWREETEACIHDHALDGEARNDIVRTLVTLLVAKYGPRPGAARCQQMARALILKHPFMADDLGSGYVSIKIIIMSITFKLFSHAGIPYDGSHCY